MVRHSGGHRAPQPPRGGPDPRRLRLLALVCVVAAAVVLPLAMASAGQVGDTAPAAGPTSPGGAGAGERMDGREVGTTAKRVGDAKDPTVAPSRSPLLLGLGLATAANCGPALTSPEGIEAQTCVLTQGADTWARTYYRNATGGPLDSVLSLMGPGGRTVQMHCATGADDEPATCETPREHSRGGPGGYTAVTEFAESGDGGALLLRSGSNS
ncbi:hypothetical protein GCM10010503_31950 [Streptomyces lucensis JCM 4490]|uniref:Uncharacterized protein n=1 Tax=Streptomyces lucensis JCM 4490 TaxID=1306176 RepID=A0A918J901_9ACTN|nr:hypothetical protein [Streptomyces lucensis]GGW52511.1 hypothetical protein GCM10010503_31950 [Streptomyces lucensis JCM 4490]